ncbi:OLC1v1032210C1 [Oldenlandia corymbosa var. corymbosa]|uniref:RING-type E3 ubiquitin transferase n=1 Tax=Oldenlandia corymbosa var. corymbosa TaxID=529605 RepID=A0AAV1CKP1_OLDCO|nr:OLC1v1032210C1 [Oldenlandia corymbosa var. corymbosa]
MTLSRVVEHAKIRKQRNQPNLASDVNQTPQSSSSIIPHQQTSRLNKISSPGGEPRGLLICRKPKKMFFLGLGCKGPSMPAATAPEIIRSGADWETGNERRKKQGRRKAHSYRAARSPANVDICCTPPGISFSCDVVPSTSPLHVQNSRVSRRNRNSNYFSGPSPQRLPIPMLSRANSFNGRHHRHVRHHRTDREITEVSAISERRLDENWRHNIDSALYEELLILSEKIGYVGTGLSEEEILGCLCIFKPSEFVSGPLLISIDKEWKCSICQEGCRTIDSIGRLGCGHCHHIDCIKQWLQLKNECPVCKTAPIANK